MVREALKEFVLSLRIQHISLVNVKHGACSGGKSSFFMPLPVSSNADRNGVIPVIVSHDVEGGDERRLRRKEDNNVRARLEEMTE